MRVCYLCAMHENETIMINYGHTVSSRTLLVFDDDDPGSYCIVNI